MKTTLKPRRNIFVTDWKVPMRSISEAYIFQIQKAKAILKHNRIIFLRPSFVTYNLVKEQLRTPDPFNEVPCLQLRALYLLPYRSSCQEYGGELL